MRTCKGIKVCISLEKANSNFAAQPPNPICSGGSTEQLRDYINTLVQRMTKSELEEFQLDKSTEFGAGDPERERNTQTANIFLGMCSVKAVNMCQYAVGYPNHRSSYAGWVSGHITD